MQNDIEEIIKKAADDGRLVILTADSIEAMTAAPLRRVMPLCKQFQLSGAEGRLLARLVQHGRATKEELHPICSNRASPGKAKSLVGVIIHKLRRKVAPAGIEIVTVRDTGFELPAASRDKIRELLGEHSM